MCVLNLRVFYDLFSSVISVLFCVQLFWFIIGPDVNNFINMNLTILDLYLSDKVGSYIRIM